MTVTIKPLTLPIQGMTCASCVAHVERVLTDVPGVSNVVVNLGMGKANLTYDPARACISALAAAVADVGYTVPTTEVTLDVRDMTCASCVGHVERALTELDGVLGAVVNLGLGTARVTTIPGVVPISAMKQAMHDAGYEAAERGGDVDALDRERQARVDEIRRQGRNLLVAGTVGLLVMIGTFYDILGPLQAIASLTMMGLGSIEIAEKKAAQHGASVYLYQFGYKSEMTIPGTEYSVGTPHAMDITFKFNNETPQNRPGFLSGNNPTVLLHRIRWLSYGQASPERGHLRQLVCRSGPHIPLRIGQACALIPGARWYTTDSARSLPCGARLGS